MLKPEEVKKRLEAAQKIEPWVQARVRNLRGMPREIRELGLLILGRDGTGKDLELSNLQRVDRLGDQSECLAKLNESELLQLGHALFPRFPDVFRAAWDMHKRLPVQRDFGRQPFRAPNRPDLLLPVQRNFLNSLIDALQGYEEDLPWIAAHAAHFVGYGDANDIGILLAAAIDLGGQRGSEVERILRDSAAGTHDIGQFGRHVTAALLCSSRPDNWDFIAKMLLAAQRQEGLRQVILETVDFSHPDAFRRMLRVIDENNLVRFSATVRAADVWFGLQLDSSSTKYVEQKLHDVATLLDDQAQLAAVLTGDDAEKAYFALWSIAFEDAPAAVEPAKKLLRHRKPEVRFLALHLLNLLELPEISKPVQMLVNDDDLRIATYAASIAAEQLSNQMLTEMAAKARFPVDLVAAREQPLFIPPKDSGDMFEQVERLIDRIPEKPKPTKPLVWPWLKVNVDRRSVSDHLVVALGDRSPARLMPHLSEMSPCLRGWTAELLGAQAKLDEQSRSALLELVGDAAPNVREAAVAAMRKAKITSDDLPALEPLLSRKASDLRRGLLALILSLDDATVLASAQRLLSSKNLPLRLAALDLLTQFKDASRGDDQVRALAESFQTSRNKLERDEQVYIEKLLDAAQEKLTLDDGLGLMDPAKRTPPTPPKMRDVNLATPAALKLLKSLDDLVHSHCDDPVTVKQWNGDNAEQLLGAMEWQFPQVFAGWNRDQNAGSWKNPLDDLPLKQLWFDWWQNRPAELRDADGFELARAVLMVSLEDELSGWQKQLKEKNVGAKAPKLRYETVVQRVLQWLVAYEMPKDLADFALDGREKVMVSIPTDKLALRGEYGDFAFREFLDHFQPLEQLAAMARDEGQWTAEHTRRTFALERWIDEPGVPVDRDRPDWRRVMLPAFELGFANEHDLLDSLLAPQEGGAIRDSSAALRRGELAPKVAEVVRRAINRVLEIELLRGEVETPATDAALHIAYAGGSDVLIRLLQAIGKDPKLQRTYSWGDASKGKLAVFSHLIRATFPAKDESPDAFARTVKEAAIAEDALLAVAFYAPQWARFIQAAEGWPLLEEAVWWIHAHTKDRSWRVEEDTREGWNAEIRKLTPLTLDDLMEGAVDVEWFGRVYQAIGPKRWERLDEFAKYASGGAGHKRAQLFAEAMLGKARQKQLVQEIEKKRKQDAVRALGLLPLDKKDPKKDVLSRYRTIQEFVRGSRKFGSQRQASEKLCARIGQENLARTAGYPDPIRLQWAMEGLANADMAKGPVVVKVKDFSVSLAVDGDGLPEVSFARGGKPLKALPPEAKKNAKVQELLERKTDLRRSAGRMRQSLELAMCRGDQFKRDELMDLMGNVVLRPMLERLVFIGDGIAGYPAAGGKVLKDHAGNAEPVKKNEILRLAHPVDFLKLKQWTQWQRDCFTAERVQPFKQIFRELYVLTEQEKSDSTFSRRYAGQQVNPRQAMALLGSRGWITAPQAGVFRTFHDEKIVAWIEFMEPFFTPADVEGLTVEKVRFARRGGSEYEKLEKLPPRLFSEVMRDVDLIVSVAHRGAVDPEASASTLELRSSLLRETLRLLKINNVKIQPPHVKIDGSLAEYSIHLGSATTHMLPGGTLFIVPVHSQHRGRIFLPFADDDPKTAEVISKVLLLARDEELKDPNLLDQIRARAVAV